MSYLGNSPGVASQRIVTTFTATAGQTTFTPSSGYALGYCDVFQNGVKLVAGDDYTASNGTTVVLATGASAGDSVEVVAYIPRGLSDGYTKSEADARFLNLAGGTITGKLGIGKAVEAGWQSTRTVLQVGNIAFDTIANSQAIMRANNYWDGTTDRYIGAGNASYYQQLNGEHSWGSAASGSAGASLTFSRLMTLDASGRLTALNQPSFLASGSKTITAGSWQKISDGLTTTQHNVGSCYNTSSGTFTAPVTGRYTFYCGGFANLAGNGDRYAFNFRINNGPQTYISGGNYSLSDTPISGASVTLSLAAGDYVDLLSFSALAVTYGSGPHTFYFGGHLLC